MGFLDSKNAVASWQAATSSLITSRRGKNEPTLFAVDELLGKYGKAETDQHRLGILDALFFVLHKWLADYSGSRAANARLLLGEVTAQQKIFKDKKISAIWAKVPDPIYPEFTARNKNKGDKYFTLGMLKNAGLGKDLNDGSLKAHRKQNEADPDNWHGLTYMSEGQRVKFLIEVKGGLLYYSGGTERVDTGTSHVTKNKVSNGVYIFVMDGTGRIFSAAKQDVEHHSSFLAGNPAAAAGCMKVVSGKVTYVNAMSGHYAPMKEDIDQFLAELRSRGVDLSGTELDKMGSRLLRQANSKAKNARGARLYPTGPREEWC